MNKRPLIISAIVILAFAWYYFIFKAFPVNMGFLNAVTAFSATIILSFSFFMGPLSNVIHWFKQYLHDRKEYGLVGYSLASIHLLLAIMIMLEPGREMFFADVGSLVFAGMAFVIFTIMAFTSTNKWVTQLGYDNWKMLQRTGYIALASVAAHIALLEEGVFLSRDSGIIAINFILLILILRIILLFLGIRSQEKIVAW